jgi:hypothetical protein
MFHRVDLIDACEHDRDAQRLGEDDFAQVFPLGFGERLGIVDPEWQIVGIENDRGYPDRPGERAAPDLIDAGDPSMAAGESLALEIEVRRGRRRERRRGELLLHRSQRCSSRITPARRP